MKKAVGHLIPFMEKEREETKVLTGIVEEEASHLSRPLVAVRNWLENTYLGRVGTMVFVIEDKIEKWSNYFTRYRNTLGFASDCGFMKFLIWT